MKSKRHGTTLERLLWLLMERGKAEAVVGDLRELANDRNPLWFYKEFVGLLISLCWPGVCLISLCALVYMFEMSLLSRVDFLGPRTNAIGYSISRWLHIQNQPGIVSGFTMFWNANTEVLMAAILPLILRFGSRSKMAILALILWLPLAMASATHHETFCEIAMAINLVTIGVCMNFRSWRKPTSILLVAFMATTGVIITSVDHFRPALAQFVGNSMILSLALFFALAWTDLAVFMVLCVWLNRLWQTENGQQAAV